MSKGLVLKMGGSLGNESLKAIVQTVQSAQENHVPVIIVHGGGPRISLALKGAGIELPFVNGHRLTTVEAIATIQQVLSDINEEITQTLRAHRIPATGVPIVAGVLAADPIPGLDRTARVREVKHSALQALTNAGQVPVIAPIALQEGKAYNTNADLAAAAVAGAFGADRVVFLTDVPGIYEDFEAKTLLTDTSHEYLRNLLDSGRFHSGMIPKVEAVLASLSAGVESAFVVDGRNLAAVSWAAQVSGGDQSAGRPPGTRIVSREVLI